MPDVSLNGIEFKIKGSANEASASVQNLINKVNELRSSMSGLKSVQATAKAVKSVGDAAKKANTPLKNFASSLKRIAFYRILRGILKSISQAFQEGLKNAYQFSKATGDGAGLAAALDNLATKSLTMKNQLGAAFGGLLTAITPIVIQIIQLVTRLAEALTRLMAILGGGGQYLKAKDFWTDWGEAAEGAGGAAKKALEYLAPFDELNVLPDPKSGGGGGSSDGWGDMFEYGNLTEWEQQLMENLQNFQASFEIAFDDVFFAWENLTGEQIAEKVIVGLGGLLGAAVGFMIGGVPGAVVGTLLGVTIGLSIDSLIFDHDGVISKQELSQMISGALIVLCGGVIGFIAGGGIGGALIGASIGFGLTLAIEGLKVLPGQEDGTLSSQLLDQLATAMTIFTGAAIGFVVGGVNGALIGATIGLGISLVIESMTYENNVGDNGGKTGLDYFILDVLGLPSSQDWINWFNSVMEWIDDGVQWLCEELVALFTGTDLDTFNQISDEWAENAQLVVDGFLQGIADGLNDAVQWVKDNIFNPIVNAIKSVFGIHSPAENMKPLGEQIAEGIKSGMESNWTSDLQNWLITNIYNPLVSKWNALVGDDSKSGLGTIFKKLGEDGKSSFKEGWDGAKEKITMAVGLARDGWTTVRQWITDKLMGGKIFKGILLKRDGWETVRQWIADKLMGGVLNKPISLARDGWTSVSEWIKKSYLGGIVNKVVDLTVKLVNSDAAKKFIDAWNALKNKVLDLKVSIAENIRDAWNKAARAWNGSALLSKLAVLPYLANGGAYYGNAWHDIPQYADGGFPSHGSLFVAGESGAELVSHIGGRTEVLNQSQIASAVASGVSKYLNAASDGGANEDALYRAFKRALDETDFGGDIELDGEKLYRNMVNRNREMKRAYGVNLMAT